MQLALLALLINLVLEVIREVAGESKVQSLRQKQQELQAEVAELKAQAGKLNAPATFARSAKLQRKAIALETTCVKLGTQQDEIASGWAYKGPAYARALLWISTVLLLWGVPAVEMDPIFMWPLGRWLSQPHVKKFAGVGVITAVPWLSLIQRASHIIVKAASFLLQG